MARTPRIKVTEGELAAAFTEWDRRFRDEPERFESEAVRLLKGTPRTYGEACAPYLIKLVEEVQEGIQVRAEERAKRDAEADAWEAKMSHR
jgi:hypothetical protein